MVWVDYYSNGKDYELPNERENMLEDSLSSDGELVQRVLAGDTNSFGLLVNRYERLARSIAVSYVRELHTADDVVQDAFVAAFQSIASLKDKQLFGVWLQGIVRRRAISAFERLSRQSTNVDLEDFPKRSSAPVHRELD